MPRFIESPDVRESAAGATDRDQALGPGESRERDAAEPDTLLVPAAGENEGRGAYGGQVVDQVRAAAAYDQSLEDRGARCRREHGGNAGSGTEAADRETRRLRLALEPRGGGANPVGEALGFDPASGVRPAGAEADHCSSDPRGSQMAGQVLVLAQPFAVAHPHQKHEARRVTRPGKPCPEACTRSDVRLPGARSQERSRSGCSRRTHQGHLLMSSAQVRACP